MFILAHLAFSFIRALSLGLALLANLVAFNGYNKTD